MDMKSFCFFSSYFFFLGEAPTAWGAGVILLLRFLPEMCVDLARYLLLIDFRQGTLWGLDDLYLQLYSTVQ
jgi:hypothetical protein